MPEYKEQTRSQHNDAILKALELVKVNPGIKLNEIMRTIPYSQSHFMRVFRDQIGLTFTQFKQKVKINLARRLLEDTNLSVDEITKQLGHSSVESFTKLFRLHVGCSPLSYRKKIRAERGANSVL